MQEKGGDEIHMSNGIVWAIDWRREGDCAALDGRRSTHGGSWHGIAKPVQWKACSRARLRLGKDGKR